MQPDIDPELVDKIENLKKNAINLFRNLGSYIFNFFRDWWTLILKAIIGLIIIILLIIFIPKISFKMPVGKKNYSKLETKIKEDAEEYIYYNGTNDLNYIDLNTIYSFTVPKDYKGCDNASGYKIDTEEVYLICDDYNSMTVSSINKAQSNYLTLKGENPYIMGQSIGYNEPGYIFNPEYKVEVTGRITKEPNIYKIEYTVSDKNGVLDQVERLVIVKNEGYANYKVLGDKDFSLELLGEQYMYLELGDEYKEEGTSAYDINEGDITYKVKKTGTVDTSKEGEYNIQYIVTNKKGENLKETRTVYVNAPSYDLTYTLKSSPSSDKESAIITLEITGNTYKNTILPNNSTSTNNPIQYKVTNNGIYKFKIYDTYGNHEETEIEVTSINKPYFQGVCSLEHNSNKTTVTVSAGSNLEITGYNYKGGTTTTGYLSSSTYTFSKITESVTVTVRNSANRTINITCSKKNTVVIVNPNDPDPNPGNPGTPSGTSGTAEFHFLYNGRVDAILIRNGDHAAFIDSGYPADGTFSVEYMKKLGITKLDFIIGSHGDNNHVGGFANIVKNMEVGKVYLQEEAENCKWCESSSGIYTNLLKEMNKKGMGKPIVSKVGDIIKLGDMTFEVIGPIKYVQSGKYVGNDNSLNHIVTYKNVKAMFTGDGINYAELLKKYTTKELDIDILKYPHHGNYSTSDAFLKVATPKYAVIQSHLTSELKTTNKNLLTKNNVEILYNCKLGHIVFTTDGTNITKTSGNTPKYKNLCS